MAAKFQKQVLIDAQLMPMVERLRMMGPALKYTYTFLSEQAAPNGGALFRFSHMASFTSWGENVTITATPYGTAQCVMHVRSECVLPIQIIDWGKNRKNVNQILDYLTSGLSARDC